LGEGTKRGRWDYGQVGIGGGANRSEHLWPGERMEIGNIRR
jgi:hypothetical protein